MTDEQRDLDLTGAAESTGVTPADDGTTEGGSQDAPDALTVINSGAMGPTDTGPRDARPGGRDGSGPG